MPTEHPESRVWAHGGCSQPWMTTFDLHECEEVVNVLFKLLSYWIFLFLLASELNPNEYAYHWYAWTEKAKLEVMWYWFLHIEIDLESSFKFLWVCLSAAPSSNSGCFSSQFLQALSASLPLPLHTPRHSPQTHPALPSGGSPMSLVVWHLQNLLVRLLSGPGAQQNSGTW